MSTSSPRLRTLSLFFALTFTLRQSAPAQLTALGARVLEECNAPGDCLANELFGDALAVCDFDDDGFADLAVGVPEETVGANDNAGSLHVFYGSPAGLTATGELVLDLDDIGLSGGADAGDHFGAALAASDYDRDGICDLAVGAPGKSVGAPGNHAGAVVVLFGTLAGLSGDGFRFLSQNHLPPGSSESCEQNDDFGASLAALPNGGLAIGVPGEDVALNSDNFGLVHLLSTSAPGSPLDSVTDRTQSSFTATCPDGNESNDNWGTALAVGRFGDDPSLVVATRYEGVGSESNAGRVTIIGSPVACYDQNTVGVQETAEADDFFGGAVATGDFDDDGFDDLAIGVPGEDFPSTADGRAGAVQVLFGSAVGLTVSGDLLFAQDNFPLGQTPGDIDDYFGEALASGDFNADGFADLAIGVPFEDVGATADAGTIHVRYGDPAGFDDPADQTFHSNFPIEMPDSPGTDDHFGAALASGDFDGNGTDDLAIGMPGEGLGAAAQAGAVTVLYGLDHDTGAFGTVQFAEGTRSVSESAGPEVVVLHRSGGAVLAASVDHSRTGGTATPTADFTYTSGTESWGVGDLTTEFFVIQVEEDTLDEPNETVLIELDSPSDGTALGTPATFTLTITDNDVAGSLSFVQPVTAFAETAGAIQVPVQRTGGAASAVTVHYATANGSATGSDYVAASGTLTWGAGETTQFVPVTLLDDNLAEGGEIFTITLSSPGGGGTLGTFTVHQVVIVDNEIFLDGFETNNVTRWSSTSP